MIFDYNDKFDEYDGAEMLEVARARRHNGRLKQVDINTFVEGMNSAFDVASTFDNSSENVLIDYLHENPEQIDNLKNYLESQGYAPATALVDLCAQVAHARNEQIKEVVEKYDSDNFGFGTAAGKARRKARRDARRRRKHGDDTIIDTPQDTATEEPKKTLIDDPNINNQTNPIPPQGTDIAPDEAHAELLGMESEMQEYDGEQDKFLPVLTAAIALGTKTVNAVKEAKANGQKVNLANFAKLFKKKAEEVANEAMTTVEKQKKADFIHENLPLIIVGVLGLVFIGSQLK